MKPLQKRIREVAAHSHVEEPIVVKDYALSYMLLGIADQEELANTLVFKGGTALKKFFFGEYRFSEDLDFTAINAPRDEAIETLLQKAVASSLKEISLQGAFAIKLTRTCVISSLSAWKYPRCC